MLQIPESVKPIDDPGVWDQTVNNVEEPSSSDETVPLDILFEPLGHLLSRFQVDPTQVHLVMIADGSGSGWSVGGGWAGVLIDLKRQKRKLFTSAFNTAEVNRMELMPYLWMLEWYHHNVTRKSEPSSDVTRIHIFTDNQAIVNQGSGRHRTGQLSPWWAAISCLEREGYRLSWHWAPRDTIGLNIVCDHLSRTARVRHCKDITMGQSFPEWDSPSIYHVNPG